MLFKKNYENELEFNSTSRQLFLPSPQHPTARRPLIKWPWRLPVASLDIQELIGQYLGFVKMMELLLVRDLVVGCF